MLILVSLGHSGKAFVRDFAGNIVLIDALKEAVQFFITGLQGCKLFFFEFAAGFVRLSMAYIMSIQPNASLTMIGLAAPTSTAVGIVLNVCFFLYLERKEKNPKV